MCIHYNVKLHRISNMHEPYFPTLRESILPQHLSRYADPLPVNMPTRERREFLLHDGQASPACRPLLPYFLGFDFAVAVTPAVGPYS